ncbi:MAG: membrane protein insertion efficiency factor YidD [Bacilli bacterium]|nr:membrane protein insertion efficiency factor YidD [Bacilli bacterium]
MKRILIWLIRLYQRLPLQSHKMCRFTPTCSNYMIDALNEYGFFKGLILGIKRILRCHPFGKYGYDPVKKKEQL